MSPYNTFKDLAPVAMGPLVTRQLIADQEGKYGYTVNLLKGKKGGAGKLHSHPHTQFVYIVEGRCRYQVGDEFFDMVKGDTLQIDSDVPHTITDFYEDTAWLEFFVPEREDFRPAR